jgi:hypothetical protein
VRLPLPGTTHQQKTLNEMQNRFPLPTITSIKSMKSRNNTKLVNEARGFARLEQFVSTVLSANTAIAIPLVPRFL